MLDMASDVYVINVINQMMNNEQEKLAMILLATITLTNVLLQLILVLSQKRKLKRVDKHMYLLREGLYVVTPVRGNVCETWSGRKKGGYGRRAGARCCSYSID